jgi:hypothetical protein
MALSGGRAGSIRIQGRGLGVAGKAGCRSGYQSAGHGLRATRKASRSAISPGSRFSGRIQPVVATPLIEVFMGRPAGWMQKLTGRGAMRSPGVPSLRNEIERLFWKQITTRITSEKAAEATGVSSAVGTRWFRHRGCHCSCLTKYPEGTYRSQNEKRLGCFAQKVLAYVRLRVSLDEVRRQFHGN